MRSLIDLVSVSSYIWTVQRQLMALKILTKKFGLRMTPLLGGTKFQLFQNGTSPLMRREKIN